MTGILCQDNRRGDFRIMFYNTENFFDTIDNPSTNDEEFLPDGDKNWNSYRYWNKVNKLFQVIAAAGEYRPPEIIGLCEVEGYIPLNNLIKNTPLSKYAYNIVHKDSPDRRGIDVALLCRTDKVEILYKEFIRLNYKNDTAWRSRDILYSKLKVSDDTLHVFVNHWPSRRGGESASEKYRLLASSCLSLKTDSLLKADKAAKIVIMGDFNDEPENESLRNLAKNGLINLSDSLRLRYKYGTYKYRTSWDMFDQFVVSQNLFKDDRLFTNAASLEVFRPDFLLRDDPANGGSKPYRTFLGPRYIGGYSDHLPVLLDLYYKE